MVVSGIMGGFLLGLIEGVGVLMNHMASTQYRPIDPQNPPQDPNVFGADGDQKFRNVMWITRKKRHNSALSKTY